MNGHQSWYKFFLLLKLLSLEGVLAKFKKCNRPDKRFELGPLVYLLDRNHLKHQNE